MSSPLIFDRPLILLLFPILLWYFWVVSRRSFAGLHPATKKLALWSRYFVSLLLVLALAGCHLVKRSNTLATVFLVDVSRSIQPTQRAQAQEYVRTAVSAKGSRDQAGVIVFGRTPFVEVAPSDAVNDVGTIRSAVANDATNLHDALRLAKAALPSTVGRKIVILSDGNENIGDSAQEIEDLRASGIRVDIAPTALELKGNGSPSEVLIDDIGLPTRARQSAPFPVRVVVSSTKAQNATLKLQQDGQAIGQRTIALKPGKNVVTFEQKIGQAGFHRYDVEVLPTQDTVAENNHGHGYVSVIGKPRVLYIADPQSIGVSGLRSALAPQQIDLDVQSPGSVPASVPALASYDAIVLSDVASNELGPTQMTAIEESVKEFGVGLGMIGGENSFGVGGYKNTPIEAALPVSMDAPPQQRTPPAAVVIVLDSSGSMAATEAGVQKVQLGARAAVQLMASLRPEDEVAVTSVSQATTLVVPLQSASKSAAARTSIESVSAGGGGIYCRQGLEDAYGLLEQSKAPIKHVILCADTSDSEQQEGCVELAATMARTRHITTTVCGIGRLGDQHVAFQRALAHAGNGQIFIVDQAASLPGLFKRDVQMIQRSLVVEKPFIPKAARNDALLMGLPLATMPPLLGYNVTTPKPGADISLTSPIHGEAVLASWRYGLGRTFAFTSDDRPHWAAHWQPWGSYSRFWAQTLRWSLRSNKNADFQATAENESGKGHLAVDVFAQNGGFAQNAQLTAHVVAPDLSSTPVTLDQTAPGHYEGRFDADQTGTYMVDVRHLGKGEDTQSQTLGLVVPYSPEFRTLGPNLPLLTQLAEATGGKIQNDPRQVFRDSQSWVVGQIDLVPLLILLTAIFFVCDIAVRRLALRPKAMGDKALQGIHAVGARMESVRDNFGRTQAVAPSTEQMSRLLERKTATHSAPEPTKANKTVDLLNRRVSPREIDGDNPFPYVASLPRKAPTNTNSADANPENPNSSGYTGRLLDAKRRADKKEL